MLRPTLLASKDDELLIEYDLQTIRVIFNENRAAFTRPFEKITPEGQREWWYSLDPAVVRVWVWDNEAGETVGFSMLTDHGTYMSPVFAISKKFMGMGYGRLIIQHYLENAGKPLKGEQRVDNPAIRYLNARAGWRILYEKDGIEYLEHDGPKTFPDYDAILKGLDG